MNSLFYAFISKSQWKTASLTKSPQKVFERSCEKCREKRKLENFESAFLWHMDFKYTKGFVYLLRSKYKWMKVIQMSHLPLYPKNKTEIHLPTLFKILKWLLEKAKVNKMSYSIMINWWLVLRMNWTLWIVDQTME